MMHWRIIPGTLIWLALSNSLFSQEARLAYNLRPGHHYLLDIEIQQNTRSESMISEEISMFSHLKLDFLVDSVEKPGLIHMTGRYSELLLSMLAPGLSLDLNSKTGRNRILSDLIDTMQRGCFRITMKESGELVSLKGMNEIFKSLASYPSSDSAELEVILNTLEEAYGINAFFSIFNLFVAFYPAVQPIRNWTRDFTYFLNTKQVQMVNRYYFTRTTEKLNIIQGLGMLNSVKEYSETTSLGSVKSSVSGTQTYDYQAFRESGWLSKCVSRQRVLVETTIVESPGLPSGLKIPSYTETLFEVKGSEL
jgi:hypothetical protein